MGVCGFYNFFSGATKTKYVSELKGSMVAVDLSGVLMRYGMGIRNQGDDKKNNKGDIISHLYAIVRYTTSLTEKGILPLYVFDGKTTSNKISLAQRKSVKDQSMERCKQIVDKNSPEYIKYFKRSYRLRRSDIEQCKALLELMGIPFIHAPEEADSQCAALAYMFPKTVSGVITDDSDVLVFGGPKIYKDFDVKNTLMTEISYNTVLDLFMKKINFIRRELNLTPESYNYGFLKNKLREFCILLGSDYSRPLMTRNAVYDNHDLLKIFIENNMNVETLMSNISKYESESDRRIFNRSSNVLEDFYRANDAYICSKVYKPCISCTRMSIPKYNELEQFLVETMDYGDDDVTKLFGLLRRTYDIFSNMKLLKDHDRTDAFSSFSTYQFKFCKRNSMESTRRPIMVH